MILLRISWRDKDFGQARYLVSSHVANRNYQDPNLTSFHCQESVESRTTVRHRGRLIEVVHQSSNLYSFHNGAHLHNSERVLALEDLEMYDERCVTTAFEMLIMQRITKISWGYSR